MKKTACLGLAICGLPGVGLWTFTLPVDEKEEAKTAREKAVKPIDMRPSMAWMSSTIEGVYLTPLCNQWPYIDENGRRLDEPPPEMQRPPLSIWRVLINGLARIGCRPTGPRPKTRRTCLSMTSDLPGCAPAGILFMPGLSRPHGLRRDKRLSLLRPTTPRRHRQPPLAAAGGRESALFSRKHRAKMWVKQKAGP